MNRRQMMLALPAVALSAQAGAAVVDKPLEVAVGSPARTAKNIARDPFRHPAATLAFWGLRPGMTVVEIDPAGGYWTEILAPYLMATKGRYIAATEGDPAAFLARYADRSSWGSPTAVAFGEHSGPLGPAGSADLVITSRNIHDWIGSPGYVDKAFADFHAVLKPGALLGIEEHRADPRAMTPQARDGYVATAFVTDAAMRAGFRLIAASEVNANPKDSKDHPFGVWTLPPTRRAHAKDQPTPAGFDPAAYEAIGESDRMTLKFRRT